MMSDDRMAHALNPANWGLLQQVLLVVLVAILLDALIRGRWP